jgi:predicted GH43/DUF377 family glycosyl hydrolase
MTAAQSNGWRTCAYTYFTTRRWQHEYIGTYTAFSGATFARRLLRTRDFRATELVPMTGDATRNKGLALFPQIDRRALHDGRAARTGRTLFLLDSDEITHWQGGKLLMAPKFAWEFIQIGNCGAPILIDEGGWS